MMETVGLVITWAVLGAMLGLGVCVIGFLFYQAIIGKGDDLPRIIKACDPDQRAD